MARADDTRLAEAQARLFLEPNLAQFVTLMPDGSPHVSPVWIDYRDGLIWVNTAEGRQKHRNVLRDPRVAVAVLDRGNDYRWVSVTGRVVEVTRDGADDHIDAMAKKYTGAERYRWHRRGEHRVLVKIRPERVFDRT